MKQIPLALATDYPTDFDNYIPGENLECLMYLQDAVSRLGQDVPPPVYLWGGQGSGKTHLLLAIAHACSAKGLKHGCIDRQTLSNTLPIDSDCSVVLIDDCDQLTGEQQALAFRAFIDAQSYGMWVVAAGAVAPIALEVREDLRTRLGWGNVFALKYLSDEELQAAIWHIGRSRGLSLSQDVLVYIVNHFSRDMRSIMALLNQLDLYALSTKRSITIPLIKTVLQEDGVKPPHSG